MPEVPIEVQVMRDPLGGPLIVLACLLLFGLVTLWMRRNPAERLPVVLAAFGTACLTLAIQVVAQAEGWWGGSYFAAPAVVQLAIGLLFGTAGYVVWLSGYRWLERHSRHPLRIYTGVVLAFIPIVVVADGINMARNQFTLGAGYTVWTDALVGQVVLWSPVLLYLALRRRARSGSDAGQIRAIM